jgi:hypothetical protein
LVLKSKFLFKNDFFIVGYCVNTIIPKNSTAVIPDKLKPAEESLVILSFFSKKQNHFLFSVFSHRHSGPVVGQQTHGVWSRGPRHGSGAQHLQREDASQDRQAPRRHLNIIDYRQRSNKTLTDFKLPMNKKY